MRRSTRRDRIAFLGWVVAASGSLLPARDARAAAWQPVREGMREVLGLASSGSTYVAVGSFGEIHTSPDGFAWTRSTSLSPVTLRDVVFGGGQFVAVGLCCASSVAADDAGVVLTSPDGVTWTQRFPGAPARGRDLFAVAFGSGALVAVGSAGTVIRSTDGGVTWSASASGTPNDLLGVTFGGTQFVAVGANRTVITSSNGTAWTVQPGIPLSSVATLSSVAHNGSLFIAAGSAGGLITSPNGSSWTLRSVPTTASLTGVAATGSLAVAVGYDTILSSSNGTTWTAHTFAATGPGVSRALRAVVSGPAGFLAGGSQGALFASADGISPWASRSVPSSRGIFAVAHDGAQYCAVGTSGAVARSPDGVTWAQGTALSVIPAWPWAAIARGAGVFVAAGAGAEIMSSPDCVTWTERNAGRNGNPATGITGDLRDVAFGNGTFVAVGEEFPDPAPGIPLIATSPDGVSWTQRSSGLPTAVERSLSAVGFGNGTFVALGTEWNTGASILLTSPTGVTWTSQSAPFDAFESFSDVTFANGLFVAVGDRIWTSANGTAWTLRRDYSSTHFFGVSFGGGRFIAVGRLGTLLSSTDGVTWTANASASADSQHAVAFGASRFVTAGDSATTLLACLVPPPNPVADPGFEGGTPNASWAEASTNFGTPLCDPTSCNNVVGARTGNWWAWFGGVASALEQGSLEQSVAIPSGNATLVFHLSIPASSGNGTDFVRALVDGNVVFTAFERDARFTSGYARVEVDISCFADGGAHLLRFESTSAGTGPGTFSSFFVDDVSIDGCPVTSRNFSIGDAAVIEGNAGTRSAIFTTFLSARDCRSHAVDFSTANGTATAGSDYASASGTLSFPPQALSRTVTVQVTGDAAPEPDETFSVNLASPTGAVLEDGAGLGTILNDDTPIDLSITKTDSQTTVVAGAMTTYMIVVTNNAAAAVTGATLTDTFPAAITSVSWTCSASAGSSCGAPSGTGNINQAVNLAAGGTVIFSAIAAVSPTATGTLSNTATVAVPSGIVDPDPGNNSATDVDAILPGVAVSATKTVAGTFEAGGAINYSVVLTNSGGAMQANNPGNEFTDTLPATLSAVSANATSGTAATVGNTVTWNGSLAVGASVTITIDATIDPGTEGAVISNQGTVNYDADANGTNEISALTDDPGQPGASDATVLFVGSGAVDFFTLPPCRILDTRNPAGPLGGPALNAQFDRTFLVAGTCGIPVTAKAISVNLAAAQSTAAGNLRLRPGGMPVPLVSSINYSAGQTRSNNAVLPLNAAGRLAVFCGQASGTVHFILDVNGYFE